VDGALVSAGRDVLGSEALVVELVPVLLVVLLLVLGLLGSAAGGCSLPVFGSSVRTSCAGPSGAGGAHAPSRTPAASAPVVHNAASAGPWPRPFARSGITGTTSPSHRRGGGLDSLGRTVRRVSAEQVASGTGHFSARLSDAARTSTGKRAKTSVRVRAGAANGGPRATARPLR